MVRFDPGFEQRSRAASVLMLTPRRRLGFDPCWDMTHDNTALRLVAMLAAGAGVFCGKHLNVTFTELELRLRWNHGDNHRHGRSVNTPAPFGWRNALPAVTAVFV